MLTITEMRASYNASAHYTARIVLSDGTVVGEGYGPTAESAEYFAVKDAIVGGFRDAAVGHARVSKHAQLREWAERMDGNTMEAR